MPIQQLARIIEESHRIVFFGGAGVSTSSGIPDFRSADGIFSAQLHRTFSPEELVSHGFYTQYPEDFFRFYREKLVYPAARPNACHTALAALEAMGKISAVITQNIDGLHQMAGSKNVLELHGSIHRNACEACHRPHSLDFVMSAKGVPLCAACGGRVKPDVVLYGENLDTDILTHAVQEIERADALIVGGTSLVVYPAAGLVRYFHGKHTVLINKSPTSMDRQADLVIADDIAAAFQALMGVLHSNSHADISRL